MFRLSKTPNVCININSQNMYNLLKLYCAYNFLPIDIFNFKYSCILFVSMKGNTCVAGWVIKGKYSKITSQMYAVFEFMVHYLVHMIALIFLYGKVIRVSKRMLQKQEDTTSANTQKV